MPKAHFGLIGLGVMGENLILNAERNGFSSVIYNRTYSKTQSFLAGRGYGKNIIGATSLQDFVDKLERPRRILMMIKAGQPIDDTIESISNYLQEGDLLIDGGNSLYTDTERRVSELEKKRFGYIGMGISGGAKGALEGPSMMPGGTQQAYKDIESLLSKMAAQVSDGPCVAYIGPRGAGHFVKTVHNGIEYGIEQILAEAYDLMKRVSKMNGEEMADIFDMWNNTEELASYLVEITAGCLRTKDLDDGSDLVEKILDKAGQKGTGLWTVISALEMGVSVPTIYASLNARVMSSMKAERILAESILIQPEIKHFDMGTPSDGMVHLQDACILACIVSYAQGISLLMEASKIHEYNLDISSISQIWKGGCIIRSRLLNRIQEAYARNPSLPNLLLDPWFATQVNKRLTGLCIVVSGANNSGIPVPCFSSTLDYINSYRTGRLPQNLVQAMRDCFGAHTYERIDKKGNFHTDWL